MQIRQAVQEDLLPMLEIYNHEVVNGTATLDLHPRTADEWQVWFDAHNVDNHPLIVAAEGERVIGYASLSSYRPKEAYRSTVELSIYVHPAHRRQGVATELMRALLQLAKADPRTHNVVSVITSGNAASERLHRKFGFTFCGTIPEAGEKFGKMIAIDNYSLIV